MGQMDPNQCSINIVGRWVGVRNIPGLVESRALDGVESKIPSRNTLEFEKEGSMLESVSTPQELRSFCTVQPNALLMSSTCSTEDMAIVERFELCSAMPIGALPVCSYFLDQRSSFWNPGH